MSIVREFEKTFYEMDVDALLACFTDGATYTDNFFGAHTGTASLRAMFERMFREGRDYSWVMDTVVENSELAAAEWSFSYVATDAIPRSAGKRVRFRGMSFFDLERGRIAAYLECFDVGVACVQLGFSPESIAKVLRSRV